MLKKVEELIKVDVVCLAHEKDKKKKKKCWRRWKSWWRWLWRVWPKKKKKNCSGEQIVVQKVVALVGKVYKYMPEGGCIGWRKYTDEYTEIQSSDDDVFIHTLGTIDWESPAHMCQKVVELVGESIWMSTQKSKVLMMMLLFTHLRVSTLEWRWRFSTRGRQQTLKAPRGQRRRWKWWGTRCWFLTWQIVKNSKKVSQISMFCKGERRLNNRHRLCCWSDGVFMSI